MIEPGHERRHASSGAGFTDAVTYAFADPARELFGLARLGISEDEQGSALAVLFHRREPVAVTVGGGLAVPEGADWGDLRLEAVATAIDAPLERWTLAWDADGGAVELTFEAASAPAAIGAPVAALGGLDGYVQLCRVTGRVRAGSETLPFDGTGERRHEWGVADWTGLELVRTVSVWLGDDAGGVALTALRPAGSRGHDEERVWAALVEGGEPVVVEDPRLSTTYDGDGHQRRAGLELWVSDEDPYPRRAAGQVVCGTSLDLGALRLDLAFMRWHADAGAAVGRYDVLRRA